MSWYDPMVIDEFIQQNNAIEGKSGKACYIAAWDAFEYLLSQDRLTQDVILKAHEILMEPADAWDLPEYKYSAGKYRTAAVWVGGRPCAHHETIETSMERRVIVPTMDDFLDWKQLHIEFELIHPFFDGNGRIGRMIMNWTRINRCGGLPVLIIHTGEEQMEYYKWFGV